MIEKVKYDVVFLLYDSDTDPVCIPSPENGDINTQYQLLHEGTAETKVESPAL